MMCNASIPCLDDFILAVRWKEAASELRHSIESARMWPNQCFFGFSPESAPSSQFTASTPPGNSSRAQRRQHAFAGEREAGQSPTRAAPEPRAAAPLPTELHHLRGLAPRWAAVQAGVHLAGPPPPVPLATSAALAAARSTALPVRAGGTDSLRPPRAGWLLATAASARSSGFAASTPPRCASSASAQWWRRHAATRPPCPALPGAGRVGPACLRSRRAAAGAARRGPSRRPAASESGRSGSGRRPKRRWQRSIRAASAVQYMGRVSSRARERPSVAARSRALADGRRADLHIGEGETGRGVAGVAPRGALAAARGGGDGPLLGLYPLLGGGGGEGVSGPRRGAGKEPERGRGGGSAMMGLQTGGLGLLWAAGRMPLECGVTRAPNPRAVSVKARVLTVTRIMPGAQFMIATALSQG